MPVTTGKEIEMSMFDEFFMEWAAHDRREAEKALEKEQNPQKRKELEEKLKKAKKAEAQEIWAQAGRDD